MKILIFFAAAAITMTPPLFAAKFFRPVTHKITTVNQGPKIRVLLAKDITSALIESKGAYKVVNKADGSILSSGSIGKRYGLHAIQKGLRWGEEYPDVYQITIKPINEESSLFVEGIQYKGSISVYCSSKNRITIVNEVPIESFLTSVMSIKYGYPLAKESLAAATILERSALYELVKGNYDPDAIYDCTKEEMGYQGYGVTKQWVGVDEAVLATRFMVVGGERTINIKQLEELAHLGLDAKQILHSCYPSATIGLTTAIPSKIIR